MPKGVEHDEGVFYGAEIVKSIACVGPLQAYLDLRNLPERAEEAAEHLRKERLKWRSAENRAWPRM